MKIVPKFYNELEKSGFTYLNSTRLKRYYLFKTSCTVSLVAGLKKLWNSKQPL